MRAKGAKLALGAALFWVSGATIAQTGDPGGSPSTAGQENGQPAIRKEDLKTVTKELPFTTKYEFSRTVGPGRMVLHRKGQSGKLVETYRLIRKDGRVAGRELIRSQRVDPVDALYLIGRSGYTASRSSFTRSKVLVMEATAYDPSAGRGAAATFRTANGMRARYGLVAVDPRVIKLGTMVFVEGYGIALAADTGGAIKGHRIDLCMDTYAEAIRFGRRKVRVHILK